MSDKLRLAKNLRLARVGAGLSQIQVAKLVEKSRQTVSAWEREDEAAASPDDADLDILAKAYGTTRSALRYGEDATSKFLKEASATAYLARIPKALDILSMEFELDARKLDATEEDMLYIRNALRSPEAIQMFRSAPAEVEQIAEMQRVIELLRGWLTERIKRRAGAIRVENPVRVPERPRNRLLDEQLAAETGARLPPKRPSATQQLADEDPRNAKPAAKQSGSRKRDTRRRCYPFFTSLICAAPYRSARK